MIAWPIVITEQGAAAEIHQTNPKDHPRDLRLQLTPELANAWTRRNEGRLFASRLNPGERNPALAEAGREAIGNSLDQWHKSPVVKQKE